MNGCEAVKEFLCEYLDGELPAAQRADVERHLEACAACRGEYAALKSGASAVQALPRRSAPASILAGVRSRLAEGAAASSSERVVASHYWRTASLSAAAFLMLGVIIWALYSPHMPPSEGRVSDAPAKSTAEAKRAAPVGGAPAVETPRADPGLSHYRKAEAQEPLKETEALQRPALPAPAPAAQPAAPPPAATAPADVQLGARPRPAEPDVKRGQAERKAGKLAGAELRTGAVPNAPAPTEELAFGKDAGRLDEKPSENAATRAKKAEAPSVAALVLPKDEANKAAPAQTMAPKQPAEPFAQTEALDDVPGQKLKQDAQRAIAPKSARKEAPNADEEERGAAATPPLKAPSGFVQEKKEGAAELAKQKDEDLKKVADEAQRQETNLIEGTVKSEARDKLESDRAEQGRKLLEAKQQSAGAGAQTWQVRAADLARVARQLEILAGQSDGYALWGGPGSRPVPDARAATREGREAVPPRAQAEVGAADQPTAGAGYGGGGAQSRTAGPAAAGARARGSTTRRVVLRVPVARQAEVLAALAQYRQRIEGGEGGKDLRAGEQVQAEKELVDGQADDKVETRRAKTAEAAEAPGQARSEDGRPQAGKGGQELAEITIEIEVVP